MHDNPNIPSIAAGNPNVDPDSLHSTSTAKQNASIINSTSTASDKLSLHKITPLIRSDILSKRTGHNIFLKLDALQPSGSFKIRGVGRTVAIAHEKYGPKAHIVTSSGGNAGLAAATACKMLNLKCTIFVPISTEASVVKLLREDLGAEVVIGGDSWDGADAGARKLVDSEKEAVYIHPFIGDDLIQGHSSIAHEIYAQLEDLAPGQQPDLIACTVGGGGLIQGILRGITEIKHSRSTQTDEGKDSFVSPKIVATQDFGADSFSQSINLWFDDPSKNKDAHVTLDAITSKATSMGTKKCSPFSLQAAREYAVNGKVSQSSISNGSNGHAATSPSSETQPKYLGTVIQSDSLAAASCWQFKKDHDLMVELSCGAALSLAYHSDRILPPLLKGMPESGVKSKNIVIVVCGGSKVDQDMLDDYERSYGDMKGKGEVTVNGVDV